MCAQQSSEITRNSRTRNICLLILIGAGIIAISVIAVIHREWIQELEGYGYLGIFLINMIASAALVVPGPSIIVVFTMGGLLNPFLVGAAAGIGEGIGALASYTLGHHGKQVVLNNFNGNKTYDSIYLRIERWMKHRGALTLFVASAIINPFFVPVGMAAAVVQFPRWKYFLICWGGKTVKGIIIALLGSIGMRAILRVLGVPV